MIKQDYIIRMIQEIISAIAEVLLKRKRLSVEKKDEYDSVAKQILGVGVTELAEVSPDELINEYSGLEDGLSKLEFIAVSMLMVSEEAENEDLFLKSKLKQSGTCLLQYVRHNSKTFSLQREMLVKMIK